MVRSTLFLVTAWILPAATAHAQTADKLAFEVASIKPADPHARRSGLSTRNANDLTVENYSVRNLIKFAYGLQDYQLAGGPKWVETDHYDILAKAPRDENIVRLSTEPRENTDEQLRTRSERLRARIRTLLTERFGLEVHHEDRPRTIYRLVVAKSGPKLTAVTVPGEKQGLAVGAGHVQGYAATMKELAHTLATTMGTSVLDETGLTGIYDFVLDWTPDAAPVSPDGPDSAAPTVVGPSLFTALQEKLGLRLEPAKGMVDVMVIDRVARPSEN